MQIGDPILRTPARPLSTEEISSPEIQELILEMKATMRVAPGVGLAAPQIGRSIQLIVIEDRNHSHLTAEQLAERERYLQPFHVMINPKIALHETEPAEFFEGCLSVPGFMGLVPRAKSLTVEFLDEKGAPNIIQASGWYARIIQHEIDHLNGFLYLDRAYLRTVTNDLNFERFWRNESIAFVKNLCGSNDAPSTQ